MPAATGHDGDVRFSLLPLLALLTLVVAVPVASGATLVIDDPITDNYKASYNADPSATELRTWFSIRSITAGGTSWAPAAPSQIQVVSGGYVCTNRACADRCHTVTMASNVCSKRGSAR